MSKRCGSKRCFPVRTARSQGVETAFDWYEEEPGYWRASPKEDFPSAGDMPYEERWVNCAMQFGHPGLHGTSLEGKWVEWPSPYDA